MLAPKHGTAGTGTRLREAAFGRLGDTLQRDLEESWKLRFEECLKPWLEEGKQPPRPELVG